MLNSDRDRLDPLDSRTPGNETTPDMPLGCEPGGAFESFTGPPRPSDGIGDPDSDARGSGSRKNSGKPSYSLLPLQSLAGAARVMAGGQVKYRPYNWAKGMPHSVVFDCLMRHVIDWFYLRLEEDAESGEHPLDHALCDLLFLRTYVETYADGDDRPESALTNFKAARKDFHRRFDLEAYLARNEKPLEDISELPKN